ncbi:MAG: restriction endonuclease subunit S, partial [Gammaproteobacteria bacterium]
QAVAASTGSTRQRIGLTEFKELILICPSKEEQEGISEILGSMESEVEILRAKLEKTKLIKQGMMQELLTGRTRLVGVPAVDDEIEEEQRMHGT